MSGYGRMWQRVPAELGYLLPLLPIALISLYIILPLLAAGAGMIVLVVGIFVVIASLFVARWFGTFELIRLDLIGYGRIERPRWDQRRRTGFWAQMFGVLGSARYWVYALHAIIVFPTVAIVAWSIVTTWLSVALSGVSYSLWAWSLPRTDRDFFLSQEIARFFALAADVSGFGPTTDAVIYLVLGLIFVATLPYVTRGMARALYAIGRAMLGRWHLDALRDEIVQLDESRGAAVSAEDQAIRKLERDIHDGPQQRLIRLQMDLAAAERRLEDDPAAARQLIAEARAQASLSLEELRAFSRGFAPPILLDRGLRAALTSLAASSSIPVTLHADELDETLVRAELQRNLYFVVAELLANAGKHSNASSIVVDVRTGNGAVTADVSDDGVGGAREIAGHGLAGIRDRVSGLRGAILLNGADVPGTRVTVELPLI